METASTPSLLLPNLPNDALAGIDLLSFTTKPQFRGVKNLPPGFHFVFVGSDTYFSLRQGAWFNVDPPSPNRRPEIIIKKWNDQVGDLEAVNSEADILRARANIGSLWHRNLTPYRQTSTNSKDATDPDAVSEDNDWRALTTHVHLVAPRITNSQPGQNHHALSSASSAPRDTDHIPGLEASGNPLVASEHHLNFLPLDLKQTWATDATGRERTENAQDRSWSLHQLLSTHLPSAPAATTASTQFFTPSYASDPIANTALGQILGELQFTFIAILTLNNYSCLEQWKRLLTLLLTCKTAIPRYSDFFSEILSTLKLQLSHCADAEAGLFDLSDENESLLKKLLVRFRKGLEDQKVKFSGDEAEGLKEVEDELVALEKWLTEAHGWSFGGKFNRAGMMQLEDGEEVFMTTSKYDEEDETGDFAPAVVELSEAQRRELGLEGVDALDLGGGVRLPRAKEKDRPLRAPPQEYSMKIMDDSDDDDGSEIGSVDSDDLEDIDGSYGMNR